MKKRDIEADYARSLVTPDPRWPGVTMKDMRSTIRDMLTCADKLMDGEGDHYRSGLINRSMLLADQAKKMRARASGLKREVKKEMARVERIRQDKGET